MSLGFRRRGHGRARVYGSEQSEAHLMALLPLPLSPHWRAVVEGEITKLEELVRRNPGEYYWKACLAGWKRELESVRESERRWGKKE